MKIIWSPAAISHLSPIHQFVALDKPEAARRLTRIISAVEQLARHPHLGCPGRDPGTRELIVAGTPCIIPYRVRFGRLDILSVLHAAQDRPSE
jgi:toxin ParE1/3/4